MTQYRLHWRDGSVNDVEGDDVAKAMTLAGFGGGSISALHNWEVLDEPPSGQPAFTEPGP